jgi:ParB-like chromosome segregation protein Spo0J
MTKDHLQIEYIKIADITPYDRNARKHSKADVAAIKASIQSFGMNDPIGIWSEKNIIIEGYGRLQALKELAYTEAPCVRLDHMTDEQRRAYALAHNKTAELSEWDFTALEQELAALDDLDFDMTDFGFEEEKSKVGKSSTESDLSDRVQETFEVIIECSDETHQEEVYNKLAEEGYKCRVLTL